MNKKQYKQFLEAEPKAETKRKIRCVIYYQSIGKQDKWIAKKLGYKNVSSISIHRNRRWFKEEARRMEQKLGKTVGKKQRTVTDTDKKQIIKLNTKGFSDQKISDKLGIPRQTIAGVRVKMGVPHNCPKYKKSAPYTDAEIQEMIRLRMELKLTYKEIGKRLNRDPNTIRNHLNKKIGKTPSPRSYNSTKKKWAKVNPEFAEAIASIPEYQDILEK